MSDSQRPSRPRSGGSIGAMRQQNILALVERGDVVAVGEIAQKFGVHTETIRRDIKTLEREGLLKRVHGGAIASEAAGFNARRPIAERLDVDRQAKMLAAEASMALFEDGMNIFLGASSTLTFVAEALVRSGKSMTVTTNMLDVATILAASPRFSVTLVGGLVNFSTRATTGSETLSAVNDRVFDLSVLGASAINFKYGFLGPMRAQVDLAHALAARSGAIAYVMHRAKIDRTDSHVALPLNKVHALATDGEPTREQRTALEAAGIQVLVPPTDPNQPS